MTYRRNHCEWCSNYERCTAEFGDCRVVYGEFICLFPEWSDEVVGEMEYLPSILIKDAREDFIEWVAWKARKPFKKWLKEFVDDDNLPF